MLFKSKLFVLFTFGIAVIAAGVLIYPYLSSAGTLSTDIFPLGLEGLSLVFVEQETPDNEIAEGLAAYYQSEEKEIDVFFYRMRSASIAKSVEQGLIPGIKADYVSLFDKVDWEDSQTFSIGNYEATAIRFRVYLEGDYLDGGFAFVAVKDYFILIQIFGLEKPSFPELERVLETFVNKISETDGPGEQEEEEEEECDLPNFCCLSGYSYIYAHDYHNKNYEIHKASAGLIPRGAIIVPERVDEDDLPLAVPQVCDIGMKTGECVYNYNCPSGICTEENLCIKTRSEKFQEIENQEVIEKIYEDQTSYKEEYADAYQQLEDRIVYKRIKKAELGVSLEVQGNTAGKMPAVNQGDEVEVRLEIENDSKDDLTLSAEIFYPGYEAGLFALEEKKYILTLESEGGFSSFIGSFKTAPKFIEVPEESKLYIYSKVIPHQTGYLDIRGMIYYEEDKESEISSFILVKQRPCDWWPICL